MTTEQEHAANGSFWKAFAGATVGVTLCNIAFAFWDRPTCEIRARDFSLEVHGKDTVGLCATFERIKARARGDHRTS